MYNLGENSQLKHTGGAQFPPNVLKTLPEY